jgi:hypothetical protein
MTPLTKTVNGVALPLYVLRRISDKFIINSRALSNTTGLPNPGPDQEYLPILTDEPPDHDPVFTVRTQTEGPNEEDKTWVIGYVVADRPKEEQIAAAENAKRLEVQKHVPPQDSTEMIVLTLAAVLRDAKGLQLTEQEQTAKDKLIEVAGILRRNDDNLTDMKEAIDAGQKPDLSAGWVEPKS